MRTRFAWFLERVANVLGIAAIATTAVLALPIIYDVAARATGHPTIWGFEVTLYALMIGGFLANGYSLRTGYHFRVRLLIKLFPSSAKFFNRFALIATLLFGAIIVYSGWLLVRYSYINDVRAATLLDTPLYLPQLVIPLGGLALAVQSLALLISGRVPGEGHDHPV